MHPDGHLAARAIASPGLCTYCEEPLQGLQRVVCRACWTARNSAHHRDYRARQRAWRAFVRGAAALVVERFRGRILERSPSSVVGGVSR